MIDIAFILLIIDIVISSTIQRKLVSCLSECYYIIESFHCTMLLASVLIILPTMLDVTPEQCKFLAFFTCGGMLFVAAAPNYLGEEHSVHSGGAILSGLSAILWTLTCTPFALFGGIIALIGIIDKKRWLLWSEMACFLVIYLGLKLI